jgi:hypothetical protein
MNGHLLNGGEKVHEKRLSSDRGAGVVLYWQ